MKAYAVVTNDKYQLPIFYGTMTECAEYIGINESSARNMMHRVMIGKNLSRKTLIVPLEMTVEELENA